MAISFACECGKPLRAQDAAAGKRTKCPHCGAIMVIPGTPVKATSAAAVAAAKAGGVAGGDDGLALDLDWSTLEAAPAPATPVTSHSAVPDAHRPGSSSLAVAVSEIPELPFVPEGVHQYRVLTQKDQGMVGKFVATKLEETLNAYAMQGWTLKSAVCMNVPSHSGNHDEIVVILER
jgi:hypothetical protein